MIDRVLVSESAERFAFWQDPGRLLKLKIIGGMLFVIALVALVITLVGWRSDVESMNQSVSKMKGEIARLEILINKQRDDFDKFKRDREQYQLDERIIDCRMVNRMNIEEPLCRMQTVPTTASTTTTKAP